MAQLDAEHGMQALLIESRGNDLQGTDSSDWVLLTTNQQFMAEAEVQRSLTPWSEATPRPILWTDDYTNLFSLLRR